MQKILINLGFLILSLNTLAQKDTISNAGEKEDAHYKLYIEEQKKEIKQLIKFNLVGLDANINCSFEFKIGNSWSWETYVKYGYEYRSSFDTIQSEGLSDVKEIEQDIKYYYNFGRREKLGKITNGFSGNYISLRLFGRERSYGYPESFITYGVGINYGIQRRIGKIGYVEVFGGMRYQFRQIPEKFEDVIKKGVTHAILRKSTRQELLPTIGLRAGFDIARKKRR